MEDPVTTIFLAPVLFLVFRGKGLINLQTRRWTTMIQILSSQKAQNLIEYAIVVALISAAAAALSTYVFRSFQAQQKMITEDAIN